MRWPFISRAHHEDVVRHYEVRTAEMAGARDRAQAENWHFIQHWQPKPVPAVTTPLTTPEERVPSLVKNVIREQSGGNPKLESHLRDYAMELKAGGMKDDDIAAELTRWTTSDDAFTPPSEVVA